MVEVWPKLPASSDGPEANAPVVYPRPEGVVDKLGPDAVAGWVWNWSDPRARLHVTLFVKGEVVATIVADRYRPELERQGIGDGRYGFEIPLGEVRPERGKPWRCVVRALKFSLPVTASWPA